MALFPCDFCGSRYMGAQQTLYPALMNGASVYRGKRRACQTDFFRLNNFLAEFFDDSSTAERLDERCNVCGELGDLSWNAFVTVYAHKADRQDFFARLCEGCGRNTGMAFFGAGWDVVPLLE